MDRRHRVAVLAYLSPLYRKNSVTSIILFIKSLHHRCFIDREVLKKFCSRQYL